MRDITEIITHPWATASAVLATVAAVFQVPLLDPVLTVLWSNAGNLFTVFSVGAFTLAPNVDGLPAQELTVLALLAGALFVAKNLSQIIGALRARLRRD